MNQILYDREAAVAYAARFALDYNPAYDSWAKVGGDCANFVSQCLHAGGLPMKRTGIRQWYFDMSDDKHIRATSSWKGAQSLRVFLKHNREMPRMTIELLASPYGLQKGDVIWALNDDGTSKAGRTAHHVALVDHVTPNGEVFIYGHTANKRNERWTCPKEDTLFGKLSDYILLDGIEQEQETSPTQDMNPYSNLRIIARYLQYKPGACMQSGSDVKAVQTQLLQLGYDPGSLDGRYGPLTKSAVLRFQQAQGIQADGIVGPETQKALQKLKEEQK